MKQIKIPSKQAIWRWLTKKRYIDPLVLKAFLVIMLGCLATFPFRHWFDVEIMAAISAMLMMPEIVLEWFQAINLSFFVNNITLPLFVMVLFILIVIKLRHPKKKGK